MGIFIEDRPQMGQQRRLPNAVQLRNQNQADATNNPRLRNQNIIIQGITIYNFTVHFLK